MGREFEPKRITKINSPREAPDQNEIIRVNSRDRTKKYGYDNPQRTDLKKRLDSILQKDPQDLVRETISMYGERIVASIVTDGSIRDLDNWVQDPVTYTLDGNTGKSLIKIGVSMDFADQMKKLGKDEKEIRNLFGERQPKLNMLSLGAALARVGPQDVGLIHEISGEIANGNVEIETSRDEEIREKFDYDYTLPEEDRGH